MEGKIIANMKKKVIFVYYRVIAFIRKKIIDSIGLLAYNKHLKKYAGRNFLNAEEANNYIKSKIELGAPFLVARFGATELLNMRSYEFKVKGKYNLEYHFKQLCQWSGFFPEDYSLCGKFVTTMNDAVGEVDFLAVWYNAFEDYYIKKLMKKELNCAYLMDIEPWRTTAVWTSALEEKKVLVIHPFKETIERQYKRRKLIFPGTNILPNFELHVIKAVQTIAGNTDERFDTWFDALEYMFGEAMKIDFDIAIIGCGAYGLPLASKIKQAGKQAVHLGGVTQLLFGIKGKRWEEAEQFDYVRKWFNDAWVYPSENEKVSNIKTVEGGCYW